MVEYRGKKAIIEKQKLLNDDGGRSFCVHLQADGSLARINVVSQYKHLGSIVDSSRSLAPEATHRAESAMHSFAQVAMAVLGSKHISLHRRLALGWSLVAAKLFFNVHVWSSF